MPTYQETKFADNGVPYARRSDDTSWFVGIIVALTLLAIVYLVFAANSGPTFGAYVPSSTVKIEFAEGHGSGVHIGDGLILTAAHVASEGATVKLKLNDGTFRDATVLWSSKASDIALLLTSPAGLSASPLSCAPPVIGQAVTAHGNPLNVEFISTYGHIVGVEQERGPWKVVAVVDMEIIPGMSGGPILNDQGEVVGIAVGLLTLPLGMASSATGIGLVVPASHVCGLLGRT